jgi:predicted ferric reductase
MLVIIALGLHRTDFAESTIKINIFIACLWFTDRLFRLAKTCWNFVGNFAILTPMADGAVRVKLRRSLACRPGSHAFLWIPSIRLLETHPFTLVSNSPSEFLIREYDGFTSSLVKAARQNPGKAWRCSVDGGYGQVPDFKRFDRVVLVAGGSGATFTFSIASSIVREWKARGTTVQIDFIWVVRYAG